MSVLGKTVRGILPGKVVRWLQLYRHVDVAHEMVLGSYAWRLEPLLKDLELHLKGEGDRPDYRAAQGGLPWDSDGVSTVHTPVFEEDERFMRAYAAARATGSWGELDLGWRAHVIAWAGKQAASLPGDFIECGTNKGGYARLLAEWLDFGSMDKNFFLVDSYEGLREDLVSDEERALGAPMDGYEPCYDAVCETFAPWDNARPVKGYVPEVLSSIDTEQVAFLSIDMNCAGPEVAAVEFFWDRLVPGAVIVLDDYCFGGYHVTQQRAFDAFAKARGVSLLALPTGQGVMIKQESKA